MSDHDDSSDGLSEFADPVDAEKASEYEEFERVVKEAETDELDEEEEFEYSITGSIKESILEFYDIDVTGDIIGEGGFSKVYKGTKLDTYQSVAIKRIEKRKTSKEQFHMIEREVFSLTMSSEVTNVVQMIDVYEDPDNIFIVFEYIELFDIISSRGAFNEEESAKIIYNILLAIDGLHQLGVVHRDIKAENIMAKIYDPSKLKLIDFGLADILQDPDDETLSEQCGSVGFVAPEVYHGLYGRAVDMWALGMTSLIGVNYFGRFLFAIGVTSYIIMAATSPWENEPTGDPEKDWKYEFEADEWLRIGDEAKDFIRKLLVVDPAERLTSAQALRHEFMMKYNNPDEELAFTKGQYDELVCKIDQQEQELFVLREKMKTVHDVEEMIDRLGELEVQQEELEQKNEELEKEKEELKHEVARLSLKAPEQGEANALKAQLAQLQQELARLTEANARANEENEKLRQPSTYLQDILNIVDEIKIENAALKLDYQAMKDESSEQIRVQVEKDIAWQTQRQQLESERAELLEQTIQLKGHISELEEEKGYFIEICENYEEEKSRMLARLAELDPTALGDASAVDLADAAYHDPMEASVSLPLEPVDWDTEEERCEKADATMKEVTLAIQEEAQTVAAATEANGEVARLEDDARSEAKEETSDLVSAKKNDVKPDDEAVATRRVEGDCNKNTETPRSAEPNSSASAAEIDETIAAVAIEEGTERNSENQPETVVAVTHEPPEVTDHGVRDMQFIEDYSGVREDSVLEKVEESIVRDGGESSREATNREQLVIDAADCIDDLVMKVARKYDIAIPSHQHARRTEESGGNGSELNEAALSEFEEKYRNLNMENEKLMERYVTALEEKSVIYEENYFLKQEKSDLANRLARSVEASKDASPALPTRIEPQADSSLDAREAELSVAEEKARGCLEQLELREISLTALERCLRLSQRVQALEEANRQLERDLLHCKSGKLNEKQEVLKVKQECLDLREERENMAYDRISLGIKYFSLKERFDELNNVAK